TSCTVLVPARRTWSTIASARVSLVNRNVATGGGTMAAISAMSLSLMTPGPLGILPTRPSAEAPTETASRASAIDMMQQILTLGLAIAVIVSVRCAQVQCGNR